MILKGNQRGHGADLAVHLMNAFDNEQVEIAEVRGAIAGDLFGAFAEFEAVAMGTRAKEPLYSLSLNPSEPLSRDQYRETIGMIEERLGLAGQPRAVVFHIKDGREHCHVVWSRIDVDQMKAIHMAHDRRKLMDLACEIAHRFGLELPPGLKAWEDKQPFKKDKLEATLGEKAQAEATGISPEQRRTDITACYEKSDSASAFIHALEEAGYVLARGDRRGFVVVDRSGAPHSLTRYVKGHSAKEVKAKLAALDSASLPDVGQAKDIMRARAQAEDERQHEQEQNEQKREQRRQRLTARLSRTQQARRDALAGTEQDLLTRQARERLLLHAAQKQEAQSALFRIRRAVAEFIGRTPGLRSVLGPIQKLTGLDPAERHALESAALARRHAREKRDIAREKRAMERLENRERQALDRRLKKIESQGRALRAEAARVFAQVQADERDRRDDDDHQQHQRHEQQENRERREEAERHRHQEDVGHAEPFSWRDLTDAFNSSAGNDDGSSGSGDGGDDDGYHPDHDPHHDPDGPNHGHRRRRKKG